MFGDRLLAIVLALLVGLMVMLAGWQYTVEQQSIQRQQERISVRERASQFRAHLEAKLNGRLLLVQGLAAFAKSNPLFSEAAFQRFALKLSEGQTYVRSLQLAPNAIVKHVFPLEGNESIIGHDLAADVSRFGAVQQAIKERRFVLAGPVDLLQGGSAVIGRLPIYNDNSELAASDQFWGFATILLEISPMIETLRVGPTGEGLDIALRGIDGRGSEGGIFFGSPSIFDLQPILNEITLPSGNWQLAVVPAGGWKLESPQWLAYVVTFVIASLAGWLVYTALLLRATSASLIKAKELAVESDRAKTEFLATMSHELRTPLNGVIGMAELLAETEQTSTQRQFSEIISSSSKVLLNLINDILDLTKVIEDKLTFEKKTFNIDQILAECSNNFMPMLRKKKLPLYSFIDVHTPLKLIGDEYRLRQVLFNLLSNALKFTETGLVKLRVTSELTGDEGLINLKIAVEDSGIGIAAEALQSIFQQFVQADASTTRRFGGSGLGLAITQSIVEGMGGHISAVSTPGEGSTFTISLPIGVDTEAEARRKASLLPLRGKRIIGISDHLAIFDPVKEHLESWGIIFDIFDTSVDSIETIASQSYDALVVYPTSLQWPDINALRGSNKPLMILHRSVHEPKPIDWDGKVEVFHFPASIQNVGNAVLSLFTIDSSDYQSGTELAAVAEVGDASVLVVDDNTINQLVAVKMLNRYGITADVAADGEEALNMTGERQYDLIFMDCEMPVMDGYTACRRILSGEHQPVIVALTAHALEETDQLCRDAGMKYTLHKPLTLGELDKMIVELNMAGVDRIG